MKRRFAHFKQQDQQGIIPIKPFDPRKVLFQNRFHTVWESVRPVGPQSLHNFLLPKRVVWLETQIVGKDLEFWWTIKRFAFYLFWSIWKRIPKWYTDRLESVCLLFCGNMAVMPHSYELTIRSDSQPTDGLIQTVHHIADQCICLGKKNKIFNSKLLIKVFQVSDLFNPL